MDTFFEQIVSMRKSGKAIASIIGIWFLAFIICGFAILFLFSILGSFGILLVCGVLFGAFKLSSFFNVEYEYIITNGTLDIDKITNRSSRKRILSLELSTVSRLEKFNSHQLNGIDAKSVVFACNTDDSEAYFLVAEREKKGSAYLVFAPDERLRSAMVKFMPKFIANSAFK